MITLEENIVAEENVNTTDDLDIQGKIASLRQAINTGEIPEDLREFIVSLQQPAEDETEVLDDGEDSSEDELAEEVEIDDKEMAAFEEQLSEDDDSVEDLEEIF